MPRGGARVGAGRKPTRPFSIVGGSENEPDQAPETPKVGADGLLSAEPPKDLPAEQRGFWQRYASLAIERRTLTPHTVPAFRLLCELEAEKEAVKRTIDKDGRTYIKVTVDGSGQEHEELKAHPLKTDYSRLAKQITDLMLKFMLSPFGKPTAAPIKTPAASKRAETRAQFFGANRA
jgi:phage terminase small subunit